MIDQSLEPNDNQPVNYRGRARGLIAVLEETRRARNRLWLGTCLTPGHGRAATLVLFSEMVAQNARVPGLRHPQPMRRGFPETSDGTNDLVPSIGRVRSRNPGPHPCGIDLSLRLPNTWSRCLCRYRGDLPAVSPPTDPTPPLSPDSSDMDLTSSRPPSLETVMGPESGYEASGLASNTD